MAADIHGTIPELRVEARFVPYLQIHEFEALLFSAPEIFASAVGQAELGPALRHIRDQFATPEEINDDPNSAPSKRILAAYPRYRKVIDGAVGAKSVGLARMLAECRHFANGSGRWGSSVIRPGDATVSATAQPKPRSAPVPSSAQLRL